MIVVEESTERPVESRQGRWDLRHHIAQLSVCYTPPSGPLRAEQVQFKIRMWYH